MSADPLPVPDFIPTPWAEPPSGLAELAFAIYQRLAVSAEGSEACARSAREQIENHTRQTGGVIALLAAQRLEYGRLLRRILPELEQRGLPEVCKVLTLYARSWDADLRRARVEVRDLAGSVLTDELREMIEVESAIPDPAVGETVVRETLFPLVLHEGRVASPAKVITSVPAPSGEETVRQEA